MRSLALALAAAGLLALGCSGDSPQSSATATVTIPPATTAPTSTSAEPPPSTTPELEAPEPPPGVSVLGEGTVVLEIPPGERQFVEPLVLAQEFGPPAACAGFAFVFRWRMDEGAAVRIEGQLRGATLQVTEGSEGGTTSGCMVIEIVNEGAAPVTGVLRYLIGEFR